jgi:hypothetical protein
VVRSDHPRLDTMNLAQRVDRQRPTKPDDRQLKGQFDGAKRLPTVKRRRFMFI